MGSLSKRSNTRTHASRIRAHVFLSLCPLESLIVDLVSKCHSIQFQNPRVLAGGSGTLGVVLQSELPVTLCRAHQPLPELSLRGQTPSLETWFMEHLAGVKAGALKDTIKEEILESSLNFRHSFLASIRTATALTFLGRFTWVERDPGAPSSLRYSGEHTSPRGAPVVHGSLWAHCGFGGLEGSDSVEVCPCCDDPVLLPFYRWGL